MGLFGLTLASSHEHIIASYSSSRSCLFFDVMAQSVDDGLNIGLEVVNITIDHLHIKTSPEIMDCCGELSKRGGMEGGDMILERSPNLFNGVQFW